MNDLNKAIELQQKGDLASAERIYLDLTSQSDNHDAHQLLGLLYSKQDKLEPAIYHMEQSLRLQPNQPHVHNNLANSFKRIGDITQAISHYEEAIRQDTRYIDAYRNLASVMIIEKRFDDAEAAVRQALELDAKNAAAYRSLGLVKQARGDYPAAISAFKQSLSLAPGHAVTTHNLGVSYRMNNEPKEALKLYKGLIDRQLVTFELCQNIGNAYADIGELEPARDFYKAVLQINPYYTDAHRNLSDIEWSLDNKSEFVASYEQAFTSGYISDDLLTACAETLLSAEQPEQALTYLTDYRWQDPLSPRHIDLTARCKMAIGETTESLNLHRKAAEANLHPSYLLNYAIALLKTGDTPQATELLERVFAEEPGNQFALAYLSLCWRILDDPRRHVINNYDLVKTYEIPVPSQFPDTMAFNQQLNDYLTTIHTSKQHPYEQTLRGGTQTQGNLFARKAPEIQMLVDGLTDCIHQHLQHIQNIEPPYHGFARANQFDFSASWSVRLQQQGFHTNHVHPMGWFSSAYYVDLPSVSDENSHAGWLTLGEPNIDVGLKAEKFIQPKVGMLTLFPSYMWHGTVPFSDQHTRTTAAFDIVPVL